MATPQLCVTVTAPTMAELRRKRDAVADADLIEMRLDTVRDPDVAGALEGRVRPTIVACHPAWEGGGFTGSEEERHRILADALASGAEYVDIEWRARFDDLVSGGGRRRVVLSTHDFDGMSGDLRGQMHAMRATGAGIVKVAVTPQSLADCVPLLALGMEASQNGGSVVIGMGDYGFATRVLAGRFGSAWTYAGALRDIGQAPASSLLNEYRLRSITEATAIFGIVGGSVMHSVSPSMHNAAFAAAGIDAVYLPFPAASAEDFVTFGRAIGVGGASVTIPHKVALFDHVDEADPVARRIGAINTVRVVDGRWIGTNTDATGFLQGLEGVELEGRRASILGAGGAARAVVVALASSGATVRIHARDRARAEAVASLASAEVGPWPPEPDSWDLLINCTPIGMYPRVDETPLPADRLTGRVVYDLVYNPPATRLMREAAERGCHAIGGLDMLVGQAHEQFRWWTGATPPAGVMRDAALRRLTEFIRDENHVV